MDLTLAWAGPVAPGRIPADAEALAALDRAGVYLRVKCYDGGRLVAYVGQSRQILARIDQHLVNTLGLVAALRDHRGRPAYRGDLGARLAAYDSLDEAVALALAEARRMRFYCAFCDDGFDVDHLNLVEGLLMRRVEQRLLGAEAGPGLENRVAAPGADIDAAYVIRSDFGALAAEDRAIVSDLVGEAGIVCGEVAA